MDISDTAMSVFETYFVLGVRQIWIASELGNFNAFSNDVFPRSIQLAKQMGLEVVGTTRLEQCNATRRNCPTVVGQEHILPGGQTPAQWAAQVRDSGAQGVMLLSTSSGRSSLTMASLFDGMRSVDWTPRMLNLVGNGDNAMRPFMTDYTDQHYLLTSTPWDSKLTGSSYANVKTPSNFELFPAEELLDGPAVFAREYGARYLAAEGVPFAWAPPAVPSVFGYHALTIMQKIVESALSGDVESLATAALRVSTPSMFHQLKIDTSGRIAEVRELVLQYHPNPMAGGAHVAKVVNPFNIGQPIVFPLPTWTERTFAPKAYSQPMERMMAAVTAVGIALCLLVAALLVRHAHNPVIRAATPSFCVLTIAGSVLMLLSNFFHTLVEDDHDCAAQVWLITTGFTILFAALFIKTCRSQHTHTQRQMQMQPGRAITAQRVSRCCCCVVCAAFGASFSRRR